jgi:hypothetical protein
MLLLVLALLLQLLIPHYLYFIARILLFILVYVDDVIVVSSPTTATDRLIHQIGTIFALKDLGPLHYFVGISTRKKATRSARVLVTRSAWPVPCGYHATGK